MPSGPSQPPTRQPLFSNFDQPRLPLWLKLVICLGIGVTFAIVTPMLVRSFYFTSLSERVETISRLISPERVASIHENQAGSDEDYQVLKDRLKGVKEVNAGARFLYIMGRESDSGVIFLVDSEEPGTDGYSPRGQTYPEASDELIALFDSGQTLIEGPVSDRWGNWLSVLSVIKDEKTGKVVGVIGLDIPATTYAAVLLGSAAIPLILALLVCAIVWSLDHVRRRRQDTLRMRGELVSIASHELRSPLTGIRWGEEMLLSAQLPEKEAKIVRTMYDSTLLLQESIEDILQLANLQSAAVEASLKRTVVNMVELIGDITIVHQLPAQQKNVTLEYGPNWPQLIMVNVDQLSMKRTLNNLISNAIKYSRAGTSVTIDYEKVDGRHVFTISDHGIGIPKSEQDKVFNGFYRASNAVKEGVTGTGMGLYLSRNVVEQHGGKLWLKSEEGKGTTVYVQLP